MVLPSRFFKNKFRWFGYKDKDWPRMIMECMYMILSIRAVFNWLGL